MESRELIGAKEFEAKEIGAIHLGELWVQSVILVVSYSKNDSEGEAN